MIQLLKRLCVSSKLYALVLFVCAFLLAGIIASYDLADPSFNSTSNLGYKNYFGPSGSYIADIFVQLWGIASMIFVVHFLIWSKLLFKEDRITYFWFRILLSISSVSMVAALIEYPANNYLPSGIGGIMGHATMSYFSYLGALEYPLLFLSSIMLFVVSLGYSQSECQAMMLNFINNTKSCFQAITDKVREWRYHEAPPIRKARNKVRAVAIADSGNCYLPGHDLLENHDSGKRVKLSDVEIEEIVENLLKVLKDFGIKGRIVDIHQGPVVTLYEFEPSAGVKSSTIIGLADDIARSLSALSARIAVIPGRNVLGIELPNKKREFFGMKSILESMQYNDNSINLPLILGKDLGGKPLVADLAKMPHLLIAGTTGSGKSVAINTMILSLLYKFTPYDCKFIMIDPKMLELSVYDSIPHLLTPVVTEPGKAVTALKWAVKEMEERYRNMSNLGVRNIAGYNQKIKEAISEGRILEKTLQTGFDAATGKPLYEKVKMNMETIPYIVVVVDEMADLMLVAGKDIESLVQRLAQMARAAGIHLIMATQRPSVDVITGVIKANFPSRVSFKLISKIDSRTILGEQGAEQLLGMGDMLYMGNSAKISRAHGPFVSDKEVENIAKFLKTQGSPDYLNVIIEDDNAEEQFSIESDNSLSGDEKLYQDALHIVRNDRKSSTSYIQRSLRIGYNRAALLVERMEREGILSAPNHSGKREILIAE